MSDLEDELEDTLESLKVEKLDGYDESNSGKTSLGSLGMKV